MQSIQTEREVASSPRSAEARRKKIAERGPDRLALITGQIQTLPPLPPPPSPSRRSSPRFHITPRHVRPESLPVELSQEFHPDLRNTHSFNIPASEEVKEGSRFSSRLRHQSGFKISKQQNFEITNEWGSLFQDSDDTFAEATKRQVPVNDDAHIKSTLDQLSQLNAAAASDDEDYSGSSSYSSRQNPQGGIKFSKRRNFHIRAQVNPDSEISHEEAQEQEIVKSSSTTPRAQIKASDVKKKQPKPVSFNSTFFSSREINSSVIASETFRGSCALIVAVLVVLCYMVSEKIAAIRPLFIVLLNNVTIVLARLYMEKIRASEEEGGEKVEANNNERGHDWHGVKVLERGLVAYQAIRGCKEGKYGLSVVKSCFGTNELYERHLVSINPADANLHFILLEEEWSPG